MGTGIDNFREQVYRCMRCGACLEVCPTFKATGSEAQAARGRLGLIEALLDGGLGPTRGLSERISRCIGCTACESVCPSGISVTEVIAAAREDLSAHRLQDRLAKSIARKAIGGPEGMPPHVLQFLAGLGRATYAGAPGELSARLRGRGRSSPSLPAIEPQSLMDLVPEVSRPAAAASGRVAFFPGCAINTVYPSTGLALVDVLNRSGVEVITPRGWHCCGLPFRSLGDSDTARSLAEENLRLFSSLDADAVVTACSSCTLALKHELPRLLGPDREDVRSLSEKVVDIHVYLAALPLDPGSAPGGPVKVTYHDPCHLRWGLGVADEPRQIIKSLPGVDYSEMPHAGSCCGGGGLFSLMHRDLAQKIGESRIEDIAATGAQLVVTGCPGCRAHLTDLLGRSGSSVRAVHTVELIAGGY